MLECTGRYRELVKNGIGGTLERPCTGLGCGREDVEAWRGAERIPGGLTAIQQVQPPVDRRLEGSSAWLRVVREKKGVAP